MRVRYFGLICFGLMCLGLALSCDETAPQKQNEIAAPKQIEIGPPKQIEIAPQKQNAENLTGVAMLRTTPEIDGYRYRCGEMVQVVNHLRGLGKAKSLTVLREYLQDDLEDPKVLVICRLLFVNPKGWSPPIIGTPYPGVNEDAIKKFPLFPIAVSDNVPFFLVQGYNLGGLPESGADCLKLCEGFSMIQEDYALTGYEKAAKALTQNDSFRKLYDKRDLQQMIELISHQASEPK